MYYLLALALLLLLAPSLALLASAATNNYSAPDLFFSSHLSSLKRAKRKKGKEQRAGKNVIDGLPAKPTGRFKYFAFGSGCGATLIARDMLLSAAHCKPKFRKGDELIVGTYRKYSDKNGGVRVKVVDLKVPRDYDKNRSPGRQLDIMLIKIDPPIKGSVIKPAKMNLDPDYPCSNASVPLTILGFGVFDKSKKLSEELLYAPVEEVPFDKCTLIYTEREKNKTLCAWQEGDDAEPIRGACNGDSGGPIVTDTDVVLGVVSFGAGEDCLGGPGVFTRSSGMADFLTRNICKLSSFPPSDVDCPGTTLVAPSSSPTPQSTTVCSTTSSPTRAPDPCAPLEFDYLSCMVNSLPKEEASECSTCLLAGSPDSSSCSSVGLLKVTCDDPKYRCKSCRPCASKVTAFLECAYKCPGICEPCRSKKQVCEKSRQCCGNKMNCRDGLCKCKRKRNCPNAKPSPPPMPSPSFMPVPLQPVRWSSSPTRPAPTNIPATPSPSRSHATSLPTVTSVPSESPTVRGPGTAKTLQPISRTYVPATSSPTNEPPLTPSTPKPTDKRPFTPRPTDKPRRTPTARPTDKPVTVPSSVPTGLRVPTAVPTSRPSQEGGTRSPTLLPTAHPTASPTHAPTDKPVDAPTRSPSNRPTATAPTTRPTTPLTQSPSLVPSPRPTSLPSDLPSDFPSGFPRDFSDSSSETIAPSVAIFIDVSTTATETSCFKSNAELRNALDMFMLGTDEEQEAVRRKYGHPIGDWCTHLITDFTGAFSGLSKFNEPLTNWNTSRATSMKDMFRRCSSFDQDLSHFQVDHVNDVSGMFFGASQFGGRGLDRWNMSSVEDMTEMLSMASSFRKSLCHFGKDVSFALSLGMFHGTSCPNSGNPNWSANPPGPFCFECEDTTSDMGVSVS